MGKSNTKARRTARLAEAARRTAGLAEAATPPATGPSFRGFMPSLTGVLAVTAIFVTEATLTMSAAVTNGNEFLQSMVMPAYDPYNNDTTPVPMNITTTTDPTVAPTAAPSDGSINWIKYVLITGGILFTIGATICALNRCRPKRGDAEYTSINDDDDKEKSCLNRICCE